MAEGELLQAVRDNTQSPEEAGYKTRWSHCSRHDEEYLETWIPSLQTWTASPGCPGCKREAETGKPQPRRGQSMEDFRLGFACIPARFEAKRLKDFAGKNFRQALEVARSFGPADSLLMVGPLGAGKTSFVSALLREVLVQPWALELGADHAGIYITAADLMERLWNEANPREWVDGSYVVGLVEALKHFGEIALLVIDDVQEIHTAEELAWLQRILAARHAAKRGTVVIGAPDLETLESVLGSRTLNQLRAWKQILLGKE